MLARTFSRAFHGGIMAPSMYGQLDDAQFRNGLADANNYFTLMQGAAARRPGSALVSESPDSDVKTRLIPFVFTASQAFAVALTPGITRLLTNGQTLEFDPLSLSPWLNHATASGVAIDTITTGTHGFETGDPVRYYRSGGTTDLVDPGVLYYVIKLSTTTFRLATTPDLAVTGAPWVTVAAFGAGTHQFAKVYLPGDLVEHLGDYYYCHASTFTAPPPTPGPTDDTYWLKQVNAPILELKNTYTEGMLFEIDYDQSGDILTLAHLSGDYELRRLGAQHWTWTPLEVAPALEPPTGLTGTPTYGIRFGIGSIQNEAGAAPPNLNDRIVFVTDTEHGFVVGDIVQTEEDPVAGYQLLANGKYRVSLTTFGAGSTTKFELSTLDGAGQIQYRRAVVTFNALSPGEVVLASHPFVEGAKVVFDGGSPPASLPLGTVVYVRNPVAGKFNVSLTPSGSLLNFGSAGTPTTRVTAADAPYGGAGLSAYKLKIAPTDASSEAENTYVVTSVNSDQQESQKSAEFTITNNLLVPGSSNTLTWDGVDAAVSFRVYKKISGLFGFIGTSDTPTFTDDNIGPDLSATPPRFDSRLVNNEAAAVGHFDGRRILAGLSNGPQDVIATRAGTETDFSYHLPTLDDDRIFFRLTGHSIVRHIVAQQQLLILTEDSEIRVSPVNSDVLTPTSVSAREQSWWGSSYAKPQLSGSSLLWCTARGGHVRELGFSAASDGFISRDLSLRAVHLFDGHDIVDTAFMRTPQPMLLATSTSGELLGLTHSPEERVAGWHRHTTAGVIESVCVIPDGAEDRVYLVVRRELGGVTKRYFERLGPQLPTSNADRIYADLATVYTDTGLEVDVSATYPDGTAVSVVADGVVQADQTVADGIITLEKPAEVVVVGLPYTATLQTLPPVLQLDGFAQARAKNVNRMWMVVESAAPYEVGPALNLMRTTSQQFLASDSDVLPGRWSKDGQVIVQQSRPAAMVVVSLTLQVSVGGE